MATVLLEAARPPESAILGAATLDMRLLQTTRAKVGNIHVFLQKDQVLG